MLYTRNGDDGTSGLFGTKERRPKDDVVYGALGTLDELNSLLGLCYAKSQHNETITLHIRNAQQALFIIQAELAGVDRHIHENRVVALEDAIAELEENDINPHSFVITGASELSAWLDYARAVSRRAEREVIRASHSISVSAEILRYLNRMSSLLYALARFATVVTNSKEVAPSYDVRY